MGPPIRSRRQLHADIVINLRPVIHEAGSGQALVRYNNPWAQGEGAKGAVGFGDNYPVQPIPDPADLDAVADFQVQRVEQSRIGDRAITGVVSIKQLMKVGRGSGFRDAI